MESQSYSSFHVIMIKYILSIFLVFALSVSGSVQAQILDSHEISQSEASKLKGAFQIASSTWSDHAGTLPKDAIKRLLSRDGVTALSYYWGLDEKNELQAIYVGTKSDGEDVLDTNAILCPRRLTLHTEMSADNILTVSQAVEMMKRYRKSPLFEQYKKHTGATMPRESVMRLVSLEANAGIRAYFGLKTATGAPTLVFVGAKATAVDNPVLLEDRGGDCPPVCKEPPPLLIILSSQN